MNKIVLFIMLLLMPSMASAQEVIAEMDAAGIATMNEELRQSSSGLKNLRGQVADLLPLDLSDTTNVENALPIANGGTGQATAQAAINALTGVSSATNEHVLTKDTATGDAVFKSISLTTILGTVKSYGSSASSSSSVTSGLKIAYGTIMVTDGSTITISNLPFTSTSSYAVLISSRSADIIFSYENISASSFSITNPAASSRYVSWIAIGT